MTARMCFVFFVAPLILSIARADNKIDPNTLLDVFGSAGSYQGVVAPAAALPANIQAQAVTPATLVDPDYWDSDDFYTHSNTDYDKFDWTLTKNVAVSAPDNFLLSPLGLKLALAILTEAATGQTQAQLASVLGFELDRNLVRRKFSTIIDSLKKESPDYILNLGSRIYVGDTAQPRQRFAAIAEEFYKTELKSLSFDNPTVASKEINSWVSNVTHGRIPDLVNEDDVRNMVVLILNTLYFKGTWRHQFAPNATKPGVFYVTPQKQTNVPFMNVKDNFYFAESSKFDAKILRMPYRGNKYAMYIIVPNSLSGLPLVLNSLSELRGEMANLKERLVDVTMPKFQFDYTSHLDGVLREMGIREAFEDTASFPGIARGQLLHQRLHVSRVLQRNGMVANELGSVAYSATEISLVNKFGEETASNDEIVANKPFMFFIQDEPTRQLLFTGRISDPTLTDGEYKKL